MRTNVSFFLQEARREEGTMAKKITILADVQLETTQALNKYDRLQKEIKKQGIEAPIQISRNQAALSETIRRLKKELADLGDEESFDSKKWEQSVKIIAKMKEASAELTTSFKDLAKADPNKLISSSLKKQFDRMQLLTKNLSLARKNIQEKGMDSGIKKDLKTAEANYQTLKEEVAQKEKRLEELKKTLRYEEGKPLSFEKARTKAGKPFADTPQNRGKFEKAANELKDILQKQTELETASERIVTLREQAAKNLDRDIENQKKWSEELSRLFKNHGLDYSPEEITLMDPNQLKILQQELEGVKETQIAEYMKQLSFETDEFQETLRKAQVIGKEELISTRKAEDAQRSIDRLKDKLTNLLSVAAVMRTIKTLFRGTTQVVKELDSVMSETAVVTDFSISDMWEKLPEYIHHANRLGVAVKEVYAATTLLYQQGLNTNQAFGIGVETMKMARIAGLDAAKATDLLTSAVRGFQMELDEKSATRIVDVYANLAAKSASNVQELSTAMSKVAALAHSTGLTFETTTALLAQGIETTREPAESIGTALKTVVARFAELKKPLEEIGEVDGELVDANRVEGALRTVGIALRDSSGQFRDLDSVMKEISAKWDNMTIMQQRYIATMAAGSRQQSRFIAMMADNARFQELYGYALDSSGTANLQFEKTLESLDAKMAKLKNAWDEFRLGILNSTFIKTGVDLLTKLLTTINKLTKGSNQLVSAFTKVGLVFGAGLGAKKLINPIFAGLAKTFGTKGEEMGNVFTAGLFKSLTKSSFVSSFGEIGTSAEGIDLIKGMYKEAISGLGTDFQLELATVMDSDKFAELMSVATISEQKQGLEFITNKIKSNDLTLEAIKNEELFTNLTQRRIAIENDGFLQSIGRKIIQRRELKKLTAARTDETVATLRQQAAQEAATATTTKATLTTLGYVAAIAAAIIALVALFKYLESLSLTAQLERAKEKAETLKTALEAAKETLSNFENETQKLRDLKDELGELTQGTKEWGDKLLEINEQVQELITQFPELAKFLSYDTGTGQWSLSAQGISEARDQLKNTKGITGYAAQLAEAHVSEISKALDIESIRKNYTRQTAASYNPRTRSFTSNTDYTFEKFIEAIDKGKNIEELAIRIGEDMKMSRDEALRIFGGIGTQYKRATTSDENVHTRIGVTSLLEDKFEPVVIDALAKFEATATSPETAETEIKKLSEGYTNYSVEQLKEQLKSRGVAEDTIESLGNKLKDLKDYVARLDYAEKVQEELTDMGNAIVGYPKEDQAKILRFLSGDLLQDDVIDGLDENFKAILEKIIPNPERLNALISQFESKADIFDEFKDWEKGSSFTISVLEALKKSFETLAIQGIDTNAAKELVTSFLETGSDLTIQEQNKLAKSFAKIDFTKPLRLEDLKGAISGAGLSLDRFSYDSLALLEQQINRLTGAVKRVNLDDLTAQIKKLQPIISSIKKGDHEGAFSQAEYEAITNANPDLLKDFWPDAEGNFIYVGDSLLTLAKVLDKAIEEDSQLGKKQASEIITTVDKYDSESTSDIVLLNRIQNAGQSGIFGIEGFSQKTNFWNDDGSINEELVSALAAEVRNAGFQAQQEYDRFSAAEVSQIAQRMSPNEIGAQLEAYATQEAPLSVEDQEQVENLQKALNFLKIEYGATTDEIERYAVELRTLGYTQLDLSDKAKQAAILNRQLFKTFEDSSGAIKEYLGDIENLKKGTDAYEVTLKNLAAALDISPDNHFLDSVHVLNLMNEAAGGSLDSLLSLRSLLMEPFQAYLDAEGEIDLSAIEGGLAGMTEEMKNSYEMLIKLGMVEIKWIRAEGEVEYYEYDLANNEFVKKIAKTGQLYPQITPLNKSALTQSHMNLHKGTGRKSSGGGGGKKEEPWKNTYDWLYNLTQKINAELREREKLEKRYNRLLESRSASGADLLANSKKELRSLEVQHGLQSAMLRNRQAEVTKFMSDNKRLNQYGTYDATSGMVQIDWEKINQVKSQDTGKDITEYIGKLEEIRDQINDAEDALWDIEDSVKEIIERGRDSYLDLEERIKEALVGSYQSQIDKLSEINDSISDTNSKLLDEIRKTLDKLRQDRQNEKTEQELADKQTRLAYLRQDTSGGNLTEILRLEREISESTESYTDQLIDQKINELQEQNDEAREQREKQIELAQSQLDHTVAQGLLWDEVHSILMDSFDEQGELKGIAAAMRAIDKSSLTAEQKIQAKAELMQGILSDETYGLEQLTLSSGWIGNLTEKEKEEIEKLLQEGGLPKLIGDHEGWVAESPLNQATNMGKLVSQGKDAWDWMQTKDFTPKVINNIEVNVPPNPPIKVITNVTVSGGGTTSHKKDVDPPGDTTYSRRILSGSSRNTLFEVTSSTGKKWKVNLTSNGEFVDGVRKTRQQIRDMFPGAGFKKGGLADFTGPAWLDGTSSNPEMVLNAKDTKNFIQLKDILGSLLKGSSVTPSAAGANVHYNIQVHVDEFGSDYDVDKFLDKLKKELDATGRYRNVNSVGFMR